MPHDRRPRRDDRDARPRADAPLDDGDAAAPLYVPGSASLDDLLLDDTLLDEAFPLGDGTADDAGVVYCPYCGEAAEVALDAGGGAVQRYVEDCPVCCRPWHLTVRWDATGAATVECEANDPD